MRSCAYRNHVCTWAPKRNHVYSASLISREGPSTANVGIGEVLLLSGFACPVVGAAGLSPAAVDCCPVCAEAPCATRARTNSTLLHRDAVSANRLFIVRSLRAIPGSGMV